MQLPVAAQQTYLVGLLPSINLNHQLKNNWSVNYKVESRQIFSSGTFNAESRTGFDYRLIDNSLLAAKKFGLNSKISGGYLARLEDGELTHRFIQQYSVVQRLSSFRLAHRVVTDQTFAPNESPEYRLRYRLATEVPLNGQSADLQEFYLKLSNEYLGGLQSDVTSLEVRLIPMLGYIISTQHKIELGIDYRLNKPLSLGASHRFWTGVNWYIEF
jgi:hypothetical protein